MYTSGFVGYLTEGAAFPFFEPTGKKDQPTGSDRDKSLLKSSHFIGVSPMDVSSWVMKAWDGGLDYLSINDQTCCVTNMASIYHRIGFKVLTCLLVMLHGFRERSPFFCGKLLCCCWIL